MGRTVEALELDCDILWLPQFLSKEVHLVCLKMEMVIPSKFRPKFVGMPSQL
jgi:hypothetical protein